MRVISIAGTISVMLFALSACGPVYHTKRDYIPPTDPVSRTCVASCAQAREACIHNNELKYESCRRDAERDYEVCAERALRKNKFSTLGRSWPIADERCSVRVKQRPTWIE